MEISIQQTGQDRTMPEYGKIYIYICISNSPSYLFYSDAKKKIYIYIYRSVLFTNFVIQQYQISEGHIQFTQKKKKNTVSIYFELLRQNDCDVFVIQNYFQPKFKHQIINSHTSSTLEINSSLLPRQRPKRLKLQNILDHHLVMKSSRRPAVSPVPRASLTPVPQKLAAAPNTHNSPSLVSSDDSACESLLIKKLKDILAVFLQQKQEYQATMNRDRGQLISSFQQALKDKDTQIESLKEQVKQLEQSVHRTKEDLEKTRILLLRKNQEILLKSQQIENQQMEGLIQNMNRVSSQYQNQAASKKLAKSPYPSDQLDQKEIPNQEHEDRLKTELDIDLFTDRVTPWPKSSLFQPKSKRLQLDTLDIIDPRFKPPYMPKQQTYLDARSPSELSFKSLDNTQYSLAQAQEKQNSREFYSWVNNAKKNSLDTLTIKNSILGSNSFFQQFHKNINNQFLGLNRDVRIIESTRLNMRNNRLETIIDASSNKRLPKVDFSRAAKQGAGLCRGVLMSTHKLSDLSGHLERMRR